MLLLLPRKISFSRNFLRPVRACFFFFQSLESGFPLWRHDLSGFSSIARANPSSRTAVSEELPCRKTPCFAPTDINGRKEEEEEEEEDDGGGEMGRGAEYPQGEQEHKEERQLPLQRSPLHLRGLSLPPRDRRPLARPPARRQPPLRALVRTPLSLHLLLQIHQRPHQQLVLQYCPPQSNVSFLAGEKAMDDCRAEKWMHHRRVDYTRRGKRFPDSMSKTITIRARVMNRAISRVLSQI